MPELPEVETVRRGLEAFLPGRTVRDVTVLRDRSVRRHASGPADFASRLRGRTFAVPRRRGKYLWLPLDSGDAMLAHLGMSGQFRISAPGAAPAPQARVTFSFTDDGPELLFADQRMFGGLSFSPGGAALPPEITHIAPDPFDAEFDAAAASHRLRQRRSAVKRVLLDQTWVSGIGNIYADEALWRARLHWEQPADSLSARKATELLAVIRDVLSESIAQGGTSFDELYVNVNGSSGYFARHLDAYGRAGQPCHRCGAAIMRERFTNRSSFRCPRCQRRR